MDRDRLKSWCEINENALLSNVNTLRRSLALHSKLGVVVKSNAYGHGLDLCATIFERAGVDWLVVNSVQEVTNLRKAGIQIPIYICVQIMPTEVDEVVESQARVVVCDRDIVSLLAKVGRKVNYSVPCHVKLETGTNRQGLNMESAIDLAKFISTEPGVHLEGLTTHFSDIEDTRNYRFTDQQHQSLRDFASVLTELGIKFSMFHSANSAATLLRKDLHGDLVRVGISAYGLWPSKEVALSFQSVFPEKDLPILIPALSWKAKVTQIKIVESGSYIGYGRTFVVQNKMRIGIIPVGHYEGYDRRLSNTGYVLIDGHKSPICGRICMNMFMVDITNLPNVKVGSVATLLGGIGEEGVGADVLASWMGSINYEVVSRINSEIPRLISA